MGHHALDLNSASNLKKIPLKIGNCKHSSFSHHMKLYPVGLDLETYLCRTIILPDMFRNSKSEILRPLHSHILLIANSQIVTWCFY